MKPGDKVFVNQWCESRGMVGKTGVITEIDDDGATWPIWVMLEGWDHDTCFDEFELTVTLT